VPDIVQQQQQVARDSADKRRLIVPMCSVLCRTEHKPMIETLTTMKEIQFPEVKVGQLLEHH
jgi:hypothetical protein